MNKENECEELEKFRICFVSGKLGDVDGVSLEVDKWIAVLQEAGHEIFTIAGRYAKPVQNVDGAHQFLVPEIDFASEEQKSYETQLFPFLSKRPPLIMEEELELVRSKLMAHGRDVSNQMYEIIQDHEIDVLVAQNTNAMPMTLLGGIGVYLLATEMRVATIFHHHDFWWERSRFSNNNIEDLLNKIMPPADLGTEHVVISSYAAHILESIKRVKPHIINNCEDFEEPPVLDDYNRDFRRELGYSEEDILIVQPTRIVPRKRIEDSVRLVGQFQERYPDLAPRVKFIISLYQGDELDDSYIHSIMGMAERLNVKVDLIAERVAAIRGTDEEGRKLYTNRDVLVNGDIVTYLPVWEGFGNALLEAIAAKAPIVTTTYLVYKTDIMGVGLKTIEVRDDYDQYGRLIITEDVIEKMHRALTDKVYRKEMVETSFTVANEHFGYEKLREKLNDVMESYADEIRASRKRLHKSKKDFYV
ncbi:MAG: glycosyltransferase family 4 protein [Spirochaetales bacterium]|nr:glycosyltransferase family 4 protein [Spirochaetales bacterium]